MFGLLAKLGRAAVGLVGGSGAYRGIDRALGGYLPGGRLGDQPVQRLQ